MKRYCAWCDYEVRGEENKRIPGSHTPDKSTQIGTHTLCADCVKKSMEDAIQARDEEPRVAMRKESFLNWLRNRLMD